MEPIVEKIQKEFEAFATKKKEMVEQLRADFPSILKPLFDESKLIDSIGWSQYTPYFNDGDECIFRTNLDYLYVNGFNEDDDEYPIFLKQGIYGKISAENIEAHKKFNRTDARYDWYKDRGVGEDGYHENILFNQMEYDVLQKFKSVLSTIPKDFYKDLFGDHVQVTVTREGKIEVDEYEHD